LSQQQEENRLRRSFAIAVVLCSLPIITSCNYATVGAVAPADIDVLDKVRSLDIMPRQTEGASNRQNNAGQRGRAAVFEGTEIADVGEVSAPRPRLCS
jgi:general secretion pathway protein D